MNVTIKLAAIRKTVMVKASQARAFEVFTAGMGRWWRKDHHLLTHSPLEDVIVEPHKGGRWYERTEDGSECEWGRVLVWEPPGLVVLAWQLTAEWKYDPDFVTELEIRFIPEGLTTRVELEHRDLERFGERAEEIRAMLDSMEGWGSGLQGYADAVNQTV